MSLFSGMNLRSCNEQARSGGKLLSSVHSVRLETLVRCPCSIVGGPAAAGGLRVQGRPGLHTNLKASLSYLER